MNGVRSWILYGAAGHTGALIARHAHQRGHRPLLAGRNAPATAALAEELDLPYLALTLDDPAALNAALADVDLVLNAAGPFLHTAAPLAQACLAAGVHYIDIGNELQVFRTLYDLHQRAQQAGVTIIPGAGFGVVATNCLARYVSDAAGGARHLEVAARAATARPGPGIAASVRENLPYGGWTRREGHLHPQPLGSGTITITLPGGPCRIMPFPTGDLGSSLPGHRGPRHHRVLPRTRRSRRPQSPELRYRSGKTSRLPVSRVGTSHRPGRHHRRSLAANRRVLHLYSRRQHPRRRGNSRPIRARGVQPGCGVRRRLRPHHPGHRPDRHHPRRSPSQRSPGPKSPGPHATKGDERMNTPAGHTTRASHSSSVPVQGNQLS